MIDTVTISLDIRNPLTPVVFNSERAYEWIPNIGHIITGGRSLLYGKGCLPHYRPPLSSEKKSGMYFPEVKLLEIVKTGHGIRPYLYITFSAPKLVFGNNFNELEDRHLKWVCVHLAYRLRLMGIIVDAKVLQKAEVHKIHYSKNFILANRSISEAFALLRRIRKPATKTLDYKNFAYNGGQDLSIYTAQHATCFYDKKRASHKQKGFNHPLYADAWELPNKYGVLRMEVRCLTPFDIRKTIGMVGLSIPKSLTLESLFKADIAKAVLLSEFEKVRRLIPPITLTGNLADIMAMISAYNPMFKPAKVQKIALTVKLIDELDNDDDVKELLGVSSSTWSRRKGIISLLKSPPTKTANILDEVKHQLTDFIPISYYKKSGL